MSTAYDQICQALADAGSQRKAAKLLGISLGKLQRILRRGAASAAAEPTFEPAGQVSAKATEALPLPPKGMIYRYVMTSAQNDTAICEPVWNSLHQLMAHWAAADPRCGGVFFMVSRFAYRNFQSEDKASWSAGRRPAGKRLLWDPRLADFLFDRRVRVANHLVFCGEMNLSPTARHPMSTLESYNGSDSAVFPHPRLAMRAEPSVGFSGAKLLHTTGAITVRNYIQRKAGLQAEFHHTYGAALAEVDSEGRFWVRQLNATEDGTIYDLDLRATPDGVTTGHRPAAIYLADLHPEELDEANFRCTLQLIRILQPKAAFIGDVLTHRLSHHNRGNHLKRYALHQAGEHKLLKGVAACHGALDRLEQALGYQTPLHVCRSNHDDHLLRWLVEEEGYKDPSNARLWHQMNLWLMDRIEEFGGREDWLHQVNPVQGALEHLRNRHGDRALRWLGLDEVVNVAGVNHGAHGHAGPRGGRGNPEQFAKLGMKSNFGHVHAPGIYDGAYFAGTFGEHRYYTGPSPKACASILTHDTGKRQIIVNWRNSWRA